MTRACIIAGTHSGCGKTSVSLGLMRSFSRHGYTVQPFKCGPDFIDPGHHALACHRPSHNLDGWMLSPQANGDIFTRYACGADMAFVEGVMGLHDGFSGKSDVGSSAHIAKMLDLPVVLVVDARSMARSAAALVSGYTQFDPAVRFAGVVFNRVGSRNHEELLREAMTVFPDIPVLGCLPRNEDIAVPSRHLGLHTAGEDQCVETDLYDDLADWIESAIEPKALFAALDQCELGKEPSASSTLVEPVVRIGVARDEAFCFYYEENLRLLREEGAEVVFFSPLADKDLPENLDALYLGGGYPELHAFELSQNSRLRKQIKTFHDSGRPIYAECGGFMYLMEDIIIPERGRFTMCGIFPVRAHMNDRFRALGYREIRTTKTSLLGPEGTTARGHEFHYSAMEHSSDDSAAVPNIYSVCDRKGPTDALEGFLQGNTLGSYVHLHFASSCLAKNMVAWALQQRQSC